MESRTNALLAVLLLSFCRAALSQSGAAGAPPSLGLIRFPGIETVAIDLDGLAAASFKLPIQYGKRIDADTFAAFLNDTDITNRFTVRPGGREDVALPLVEGKNLLLVSACEKDDDGAPCESQFLALVKRNIKPQIGFKLAHPPPRPKPD